MMAPGTFNVVPGDVIFQFRDAATDAVADKNT